MAALVGATSGSSAPPAVATPSVIVQAADAASAKRPVESLGGTVTRDLGVIRAVGARLTAAQRDRLAGLQGVLRLYDDGRLDLASAPRESLGVVDPFEPIGTAPA